VLGKKILHLIQRFLSAIKKFPSNVNEFGIYTSMWIAWDGLFPPGKSKRYIRAIYRYTEHFLSSLLDFYKQIEPNSASKKHKKLGEIPVWVCWLQGEEKMPEVVKICYESIKKNVPEGKKVYLVTVNNFSEYINVPEIVLDKYRRGIISSAHFSDVLRFVLMSEYGGMWVDATIYISRMIPPEYFDSEFYSMKMDPDQCEKEACEGKWTGFLFSGTAGNTLFEFVRDSLVLWWEKHDTVVDYVLFDYIIMVAYRNLPEVKRLIDAVPVNNSEVWQLIGNLEKEYDIIRFKEVIEKNNFHKLAHQRNWKSTVENGNLSFYGFLCKQYYGEFNEDKSFHYHTDL